MTKKQLLQWQCESVAQAIVEALKERDKQWERIIKAAGVSTAANEGFN